MGSAWWPSSRCTAPRNPSHQPTGLLAPLLPNLTAPELWTGALALPGELAFGIGLVGLLGRQRVLAYNVVRFLRRGALAALLVPVLLIGRVQLELVLVLNLVALALTVVGIVWSMSRAGMVSAVRLAALLVEQLSFGGRTVVGTVAERLHFRANTFLLNAVIGVGGNGCLLGFAGAGRDALVPAGSVRHGAFRARHRGWPRGCRR